MTQQIDWGRLARIAVVGGMSCALVLSLLWLAIFWLNGNSAVTATSTIVVILSGVSFIRYANERAQSKDLCITTRTAPLQGILTMDSKVVSREFPESRLRMREIQRSFDSARISLREFRASLRMTKADKLFAQVTE